MATRLRPVFTDLVYFRPCRLARCVVCFFYSRGSAKVSRRRSRDHSDSKVSDGFNVFVASVDKLAEAPRGNLVGPTQMAHGYGES